MRRGEPKQEKKKHRTKEKERKREAGAIMNEPMNKANDKEMSKFRLPLITTRTEAVDLNWQVFELPEGSVC